MLIVGVGLFGEVDAVPGFFHVATRFAHFCHFPLVPMESFLVLNQSGGKFHHLSIPLNGKSVMVAWARGVSIAAILYASLAVGGAVGNRTVAACMEIAAVLGAAVFVASYMVKPITRASYDRACQLAQQASFTSHGLELLRRAFGMLPEGSASIDGSVPQAVANLPAAEPAGAAPDVGQDVVTMARACVCQNLSHPETATFFEELVSQPVEAAFLVLGQVESENACGQRIRNHFSVFFPPIGGQPEVRISE